jgi:SAM-dependent methyltransferase
LKPAEAVHESYVAGRRVRVLARHLAALLPARGEVLDVGCGDGRLAREVQRLSPEIRVRGVDVLRRTDVAIPAETFDGASLPFPGGAFDAVLLVDVLHHAEDPVRLLSECVRVTRGPILIKDHAADRVLAVPILRFMDRIGNARHGVAVPGRYWRRQTWLERFRELGLAVTEWRNGLGLYPIPAAWIFGGSLQFLARVSAA